MFGCQRLLCCAVSLFLVLVPMQPVYATQDWAAYVFSGSFEAGDHVDASEASSEGILELDGIDPSSFVAATVSVTFTVSGTLLASDPASVRVLRNGVSLPSSHMQITAQNIVLNGALLPGLNHLVVLAKDIDDYSLSAETYLWAGSNSLVVAIQDADGSPVSSVPVELELADDPGVSKTVVATGGTATFTNVPPTTIVLMAQGPGNTLGTLSTTGNAGSVILRLNDFQPASSIDNNDFSLGIQGWEVGSAPVHLIVHEEGGGGAPQAHTKIGGTRPVQPWDASEWRKDGMPEDSLSAIGLQQPMPKGTNMDLMLVTSGVGAQSISRTFQIAPGAGRIKVRYRFITSEVPGGYFGSQYNDNYSISIRTLNGGASRIVSNSMNSLGLGAFDANGATAWYTVTLPIHGNHAKGSGETVQVDVAVTNVGDGDYNSAVVIDYIEQESLSISTDLSVACPNQTVTFQIDGSPSGTITWTGGGQPATGSGTQFTTRFAQAGQVTVQAQQNDGGTIRTADATVNIWETSGSAWVAQFPTSVATDDLVQPFRGNVDNFIAALRGGNAAVNIAATLRPPERAHLMHYSFRISREGFDPATVPEYQGVNICWVHRDANGNVNLPASTGAARAMENAYAIRFRPALQSRHTQGRAIDMNITWAGNLTMQTAGGGAQTITTLPRTGAGNVELHAVGAGYGVLKLVADPPHWSDDGR